MLNNANGFGTPAGGTLSTRIDREFDYWTADLLAQQEVAISESGMMKLFIGPSFRYLHENTQADGSLSSGAQVTLTEQLSTTYLGASAGAEGELQFDELTSIQLGVLASLYSASSTYDGLQTGSSTGASGISASLKDEETAVGVDIRAEIKRKLSPTIALSLVLGGHYLSYAPQMAYGGARIVSDPARPLHMEGAALLSGDIGLKLTAEF